MRETLLGLVRGDERYMSDPEPQVVVKRLNDYNVEMELRAWAHDERRHIELRTGLREVAFRALNAAGIDMPFETLRLEPVTVARAAG